jgi:hypothetical protein
MSKHPVVYHKYIQVLYVNYALIKLCGISQYKVLKINAEAGPSAQNVQAVMDQIHPVHPTACFQGPFSLPVERFWGKQSGWRAAQASPTNEQNEEPGPPRCEEPPHGFYHSIIRTFTWESHTAWFLKINTADTSQKEQNVFRALIFSGNSSPLHFL